MIVRGGRRNAHLYVFSFSLISLFISNTNFNSMDKSGEWIASICGIALPQGLREGLIVHSTTRGGRKMNGKERERETKERNSRLKEERKEDGPRRRRVGERRESASDTILQLWDQSHWLPSSSSHFSLSLSSVKNFV